MGEETTPEKNRTERIHTGKEIVPEEIERTQVITTVNIASVNPEKKEQKKRETFFERTIGNGLRSTRLKLQVEKEIGNDAAEEKKGGEFRNFRRIFNTVFSRVNSLMIERSNIDEALLSGTADHSKVQIGETSSGLDEKEISGFGNLDETYTIVKKFAEGGQAVISVAEDRQIGRIVGIKTLRSELNENQDARDHFIREARISGQLEHPAIIPVYRLCSDEKNNLHMAMKLIKGQTLHHYLCNLINYYNRKGMNYFDEQRSLKRRLDVLLDVCDGLEYAHSRKIIHCDLKPENIMVGAYHDTYLMDWGISRSFEEDDGVPLEQKPRSERINGTPRYLSPEAAKGYPCDQRSDIFSIGVILFELVTLRSAFTGDDPNEIIHNVARGRMEKIRHRFRAAIDPDLRAIIRKATAVKREDRYQNIRDLSEDLRRYQAQMEVSARPDNLPRRIFRWMRRHRTGTMLIGATALLLWALYTAYSYYHYLEREKVLRERGLAVAEVYSVAMKGISEIQKVREILEFCAFDTATISGIFLHNPADHGNLQENLPFRSSRLKQLTLPPGVKKYGRQGVVDFGGICFCAPPSLPETEVDMYRRKFRLLAPHFKEIFLQNNSTGNWDAARNQNFPTEKMYDMQYRLLWIYVGLKNGMYFSYPGSTLYDEHYDPRTRIWYRNAQKDITRTKWTIPYMGYAVKTVMITITKAVTDPETGEFYGVAGVDFSLDAIRSILMKEDLLISCFCDRFLIDKDGFVLIDSRRPDQVYTEDPQTGRLKLSKFEKPEIWEEIKERKNGFMLDGPEGEYIYVFNQIPDSDWYYVVRMDYGRFRSLDQNQRQKLLLEEQNISESPQAE